MSTLCSLVQGNRQSNWVKKATYDHISWAKNKSWRKVFTLSPKNRCKSQMPVFMSYTDALLSLCCYKSIQSADYSKGMAFHTSMENVISVSPVGCLLFKLEDIEESIALVKGLHSYSNPGTMLGCCCSKDNDNKEQSLWLFTSICPSMVSKHPLLACGGHGTAMLCKAALSCELLQTTSYELHLPTLQFICCWSFKGTLP